MEEGEVPTNRRCDGDPWGNISDERNVLDRERHGVHYIKVHGGKNLYNLVFGSNEFTVIRNPCLLQLKKFFRLLLTVCL